MIKEATRETAERIIDLLRHGLCSGLGEPIHGQMCVDALVCYAQGLPHSDEPICVSSAVRAFKIKLNDSSWSSNQARAAGMKRLAIAQLNSAGAINDQEFAKRISEMAIRKIVPFALRESAKVHPYEAHKDALEVAAKRCEVDGTKAAADAAASAAYAASAADAAASAAYATSAASAADAAASAADAAAYAANAAASAASAAYAAAYAASAANAAKARDKFLAFVAEEVVQILIEMKTPGTAWLDLAPIQNAG
jgi:hypothetical protein